MKAPLTCLILSTVFTFSAARLASADLVYGDDASGELTGSRSLGSGLVATGGSNPTTASVSWVIVDNLDFTFTYTYTLNFTGSGAGVSHLTLDLSDDAIDFDDEELEDPDAVTDAKFNNADIAAMKIEFGSKDGITGGVKFDVGADGEVTYSFVSNRNPVYHNVAVKTGGGPNALVVNTGLGNEGTSMSTTDFIPTPNSVAVPEPSAFLFGGLISSIVGCSVWAKWRFA